MAGLVQRMTINTGDPLNPKVGPGLTISEGPGRLGIVVVYNTDAEADAADEKIKSPRGSCFGAR
jgi:hypothetical protein